LAIALALGAAAHALSASVMTTPATPLRSSLVALATANVVVLWLFARALFDDGFCLDWRHVALWCGVAGLSLIDCLLLQPASAAMVGTALHGVTLVFVALTVARAASSWPDDLVESRRRIRFGIVLAAAAYAAVNAVLPLATAGGPEIAATVDAVLFAVIVGGIACLLMAVDGNGLFASAVKPAVGGSVGAAGNDATAEGALIDALRRLMADDRIYRHEGMTIGLLAGRLRVPEYRLRRLINQRLGYRNFNAFLNGHRIDEAKLALADPSQDEVPVTTIALDAGFRSLGPFNRAFKATTGVTPSEYRRRRAISA
jgi:AraC-like DNA-binding protein